MKHHIKKFHLFRINEGKSEWRIPVAVSKEEFDKKRDIHDIIPFNSKECDLFGRFIEDNPIYLCGYETPCEFKIKGNLTYMISVIIEKLDDDWYLIEDYISNRGDRYKYFICDEWEEVLGYLSNNKFNI